MVDGIETEELDTQAKHLQNLEGTELAAGSVTAAAAHSDHLMTIPHQTGGHESECWL